MWRHLFALILVGAATNITTADEAWRKHVVYAGDAFIGTAGAGDFNGDQLLDVICNSSGKTRLLVAPDWREVILDETPGHGAMHSEVCDVDGDGDLDFVAARYTPGLIFWSEQPARPLADRWKLRIVEDQIDGVHG